MTEQDHDLLVTVHEQVKQVRVDIKELKDGTSVKIGDHEARIRRLEWAYAVGFGVLVALQFYFNHLRQ